jgi:murein DD-endopeptidase MepM/ murein hydrolase activator NlpD
MRTERIRMRVFVEGVLVPKVSSATVMTFASEEARASFTMPSIPGFETEELKRASVHIYWSDIETRSERADNDWPILFEGEISGDNFEKSVSSRNQVYNCIGYHAYWEQVLLYFYDLSQGAYNKPAWATSRISLALGNERFEFDASVAGASLRQRLVQEIQNHKDESYHSFVKRIFSDCLDVNYFFRKRDAELKLSHRFASAKDPNLDLLIGRSLLSEVVSRDAMSVSGETSMMSLLKSVLNVFRYQIVHNAQPVLIDQKTQKKRTNEDKETDIAEVHRSVLSHLRSMGLNDQILEQRVIDSIDGTADKSIYETQAKDVLRALAVEDDTVKYQGLVDALESANSLILSINDPSVGNQEEGLQKDDKDLLTQFLLIPDTRFALPPTCNVIFPGDQTAFGMSRQLLQEPTRAIGLPTQVLGLPFNVYMAPPELLSAVVPAQTVNPISSSGFYPPVTAPHRISSGFGLRQIKQLVDTYNSRTGDVTKEVKHPNGRRHHPGVDIARPGGVTQERFKGTQVYTIDNGVVTRAGYEGKPSASHPSVWKKGDKEHAYEKQGYGLRIYIDHGNGSESRYAHLNSVTVAKGETVIRGQQIGTIGNTGSSTGPHLHFEYLVNGKAQDPELTVLKTSSAAEPAPTSTPAAVTTEQESIRDVTKLKDDRFLDYKYLSPEEQKTGIIPFFDQSVIRGHSFMIHDGKGDQVKNHYLSMLNSEFIWRRYQTRSIGSLNLPFNPYPLAGFPGLIIDRLRSIIGNISSVTHNITVGGGQGTATTTVQMDAPRFWDEGDPYHWIGGEQMDKVSDGRTLPDPDYAIFPAYYMTKLLGTNSSTVDEWWTEEVKVTQQKLRPVDKLYAALLGSSVRGIPYQYATRGTTRNSPVVFNKAIDSRPSKDKDGKVKINPNTNTIVGTYYRLLNQSTELAASYVKLMTRRLGASEITIMTTVMGSVSSDGGASYSGGPFRSDYQDLVRTMNTILATHSAFRG